MVDNAPIKQVCIGLPGDLQKKIPYALHIIGGALLVIYAGVQGNPDIVKEWGTAVDWSGLLGAISTVGGLLWNWGNQKQTEAAAMTAARQPPVDPKTGEMNWRHTAYSAAHQAGNEGRTEVAKAIAALIDEIENPSKTGGSTDTTKQESK